MVALRRPDELAPPLPDGRPTLKIKPHSEEKIHYWGCFAEAAATVTKRTSSRVKFSGRRACLDLFASNGFCEVVGTGKLTWGSALVALQLAYPFDVYVFNDISRETTDTLAARAEDVGVDGAAVFRLDLGDESFGKRASEVKGAKVYGPRVVVTCGDANAAPAYVKLLLPGLPGYRYILALIDPPGADFHWDALEALVFQERSMDVISLFPDAMELNRWLSLYRKSEALAAKPNAYFGDRGWREAVDRNPEHPKQAMREFYETRMLNLGLRVGDAKVIRGRTTNSDLYRLIFASKNRFGVDLWNRVNRRTPWGQDELPLTLL